MSAIRGREAEIAVLTEALDLVESGRRAVVLVEGEAGIGKTRPRSGWDSITPIERSVADLVAEGLSNPQIGERL